jgi:hypothetical protein
VAESEVEVVACSVNFLMERKEEEKLFGGTNERGFHGADD